ncbi:MULTISPECIES: DUF3108 domain-containing protein [unclassified Massilia]|uniref:DUF3108 domain-containing protein n=1 Tax=unclassified Massilia TaxID=2609279 RepID=UPI001783C00A|nr:MULTISPECIES: DUF3108 domain-containing protein [unclassified Massilia]MBD8530172.1 DUF3108 domain-containing protein [Massilia sp. CFBP 13647]MBD8673999.1 DUF3108 domain-containing protein [Massilia sp. CFBP 13721]
MNIAVHLARHRRLAAWVGLSLLLHLLALALIDTLVRSPAPPEIGTPLALRLAATHAAAPPADMQPTPEAPASAPTAAPTEAPTELPPTPVAVHPRTPVEDSAPEAPLPAPAGPAGIAAMPMPGRYQVRPPPSARLSYAVTRSAPGQPGLARDSASLVWEKSGGAYRLRLDGVLGSLRSEGGEDDAGIAPSQASQELAASAQTTRFDREAQRIEHGAASSPLQLGSQDRASVLLQLAGMGLADPDQLQDVVEIVVAGPGGARIARWQVVGKEALDTPAGALATVHLAQLAEPGEARIEVWLAPQRNWLPVQLRVTGVDGSVANQVVTGIETASVDAAPAS